MKACGGWWVGCKFGGSGGFSVVLGFGFGFYGGSMVVESCWGWLLSLTHIHTLMVVGGWVANLAVVVDFR